MAAAVAARGKAEEALAGDPFYRTSYYYYY